MMTSSNELLKTMKNLISNKEQLVNQELCNQIVITALIDLYENMESFRPVMTAYKFSLWAFSFLGLSFVGLIFGIFTGQIELIFK